MKRFVLLFKDALNNMIRNKLATSLCLGIIAFSLLILGIFNYVSQQLHGFIQTTFSKNVAAIFYIQNDTPEDQLEALVNRIRQNILVDSVTFTSKESARNNFNRQFPELEHVLKEFEQSPFPSSINVQFKSNDPGDTKVISLIAEIEQYRFVESKQVNLDWAEKINNIHRIIRVLGNFLSVILIFISVFIIYNVIKLNIYYRREEIDILRLVGATNWYIRTPFIIEGALLGILGSIIALIFLFAFLRLLPLYATFMFEVLQDIIISNRIPLKIFLKIVLIGSAIGIFSSLLSVKRFLVR